MSTLSISALRENLAEAIRHSATEPADIVRHGQRVAVIVSPMMFDRALEALEDQADEAAFDGAISGETIPWDEVKKELGLG
jgi:prevent-host-death family protein